MLDVIINIFFMFIVGYLSGGIPPTPPTDIQTPPPPHHTSKFMLAQLDDTNKASGQATTCHS